MVQTISLKEIMDRLYALENPANAAGQQRFGIQGEKMLGTSIYDLRKLARGVCDHDLASQLWETGIHDARLLATMLDDPKKVTKEQMTRWATDFDSWDICDQATDNLFIYVDGILELIPEWAAREEEFVRRAAFASMAAIAWHGKQYPDEVVSEFLPLIEKYAGDNRNFVKKAVNWALRNIGKMRPALRGEAVDCSRRLLEREAASARWIARDALKEFSKKFGPLES
jgi:3-methyladenine DNA glycosylase AlkD